MKVFERDLNLAPENYTLRAPLVALAVLDSALGYPAGTILHPTILVRNASEAPLSADGVMNWRRENLTGKIPFSLAAIAPEETRVVDLTNLNGLPADANWANVEITYTGRYGDLVPIAASYDTTLRYGIQSPFTDSLSFMWKGGMWHVDGQHNTIITTGNAGETPATAAITLFYGSNGIYEMPEKLFAPGEQTLVEIGSLIHNQVPDKKGRVLPTNVTDGSYEITDVAHPQVGYLYEGKLVTDKTFGHANYGCAGCCAYGGVGYQGFYLLPDPMSGVVPGTGQYDAWATNVCTGTDDPVDTYSASSSNTSVATVDSHVLATFVGPGTATITAYAKLQSVQNCCCRPQTYPAPAPVNVATLSCTSPVTRGQSTTCTVTGPPGTTVSGWTFSDGTNPAVTSNSTNMSWSGIIVTGGLVSVTAKPSSGASTLLRYSISVNNRTNFAFPAVNPTQLTGTNTITCYIGDTKTAASPPNSTSYKGASCADLAFSFADIQVSDNGPNNGYQYVTSVAATSGPPNNQPTQFPFIVVSDLLSATTFYNAQCGNYSSTNSTGFIAGSRLKQNVFDHEQGSVFSHWTEYRDAQNNPSNNIGTVLEAMTAPPGTSRATYESNLTTAGTNAINTIVAAANNEPCGSNPSQDSSQACAQCGAINYSPYQSCSGQPVPYCH